MSIYIYADAMQSQVVLPTTLFIKSTGKYAEMRIPSTWLAHHSEKLKNAGIDLPEHARQAICLESNNFEQLKALKPYLVMLNLAAHDTINERLKKQSGKNLRRIYLGANYFEIKELQESCEKALANYYTQQKKLKSFLINQNFIQKLLSKGISPDSCQKIADQIDLRRAPIIITANKLDAITSFDCSTKGSYKKNSIRIRNLTTGARSPILPNNNRMKTIAFNTIPAHLFSTFSNDKNRELKDLILLNIHSEKLSEILKDPEITFAKFSNNNDRLAFITPRGNIDIYTIKDNVIRGAIVNYCTPLYPSTKKAINIVWGQDDYYLAGIIQTSCGELLYLYESSSMIRLQTIPIFRYSEIVFDSPSSISYLGIETYGTNNIPRVIDFTRPKDLSLEQTLLLYILANYKVDRNSNKELYAILENAFKTKQHQHLLAYYRSLPRYIQRDLSYYLMFTHDL